VLPAVTPLRQEEIFREWTLRRDRVAGPADSGGKQGRSTFGRRRLLQARLRDSAAVVAEDSAVSGMARQFQKAITSSRSPQME
jgi:hypothetical protein